LSVIIPCFNERATLATIVDRVRHAPLRDVELEIVIVDDGSTDGSDEVARQLAREYPEVIWLRHDRNRGKGAAVRSAQARSTGDIVLIQDADLEYSPEDYPRLLEPIRAGRADVVYGSRFTGGDARRVLLYSHELGNRLLTFASNLATNLNLTDMTTCYKAVRGELFRAIPLQCDGFGFEAELTAKVARLDLRIYEVPISYHGRTYPAGKKVGWSDGLRMAAAICRYWVTDGLGGLDEGLQTLQSMRNARRYNLWVFSHLAPHLGDRILEAGAGIGNITAHLVDRQFVLAVDDDPRYVERLAAIFDDNPNIIVERADLASPSTVTGLAQHGFDTVLCINVLEHIEPDVEVLRGFHELLAPGGRAIILVPAGRWLYGEMDRGLGHHRRYVRNELCDKMTEAGFEVERVFGINRLSPPFWFFNGRVLRRRAVPDLQVRIFDRLGPLMRLVELIRPLPPLSMIAVGRRPTP
jgi:glycosyltransferase involved in cell wall biosynthesis